MTQPELESLCQNLEALREITEPGGLSPNLQALQQALDYAARLSSSPASPSEDSPAANALLDYFNAHEEEPGIWKWLHYFEIYDRHFSKYRGRPVNICEVGIFSGGSLGMWKAYFGPDARIYGVDLHEEYKAFEDDQVRVVIGDQSDRAFWGRFGQDFPAMDIVIDDGSHKPEHQIITLEETLPLLAPGGTYLCEDISGSHSPFHDYIHGLNCALSAARWGEKPTEDNQGGYCEATAFQSQIHSIHTYPFVTVIEKRSNTMAQLVSARHGSDWQPFTKLWGPELEAAASRIQAAESGDD